ncbi:unnamed protein product, partial [Ectocarpus sp. 12 AP-2014]
ITTGPFSLSNSGGGVVFDLLPSTCNTNSEFLLRDCAEAECGPSSAVPTPISGESDLAQCSVSAQVHP